MARIRNVLAIILVRVLLQGCAALSALKALVGSGDSTDRSVNVEANMAARDNKKAIISADTSESYVNKGDVTQNGVKFKECSLSGLIWAGGMGGVDLLIALLILVVARVLCFYLEMRQKNITKKLQIKLLKLEEKKK